MEHNPYQAPEAQLINENQSTAELPFYIVGKGKVWIMMIGTIGIYSIYWFYKHWKTIKIAENSNIVPVMRGIFNIFFCHSLFERIYQAHQNAGLTTSWKYSLSAALYIIFSLFSNISDRLADHVSVTANGIMLVISLFGTAYCFYVIAKAQQHVNDVAAQKNIDMNTNLTALNCLWLFFGLLLWGAAILGIFLMFNPELLNEL